MKWKSLVIPIALFSSSLLAQQLTVAEFPVPTPGSVPVGLANFVFPLMTEFEGNKIALLTGAIAGISPPIVEFSIPTPNSGPRGITPACGELWFTESRANRIGRLVTNTNPDSTPTFPPEIAIPTADSSPRGIVAAGNCGAWFTEFSGNKIGRAVVDPTTGVGSVTAEYAVPSPAAGPAGITVDTQGAVWFTEFNANKIGRLDPATGLITEYPIATARCGPLEIVMSGNSLWFTESKIAKIGRIGLDGQIAEFWLSDRDFNSIPSGIAADGAGGVWVTEPKLGRIGRLKRDGQIRHFALPTAGSDPTAIVLWSPPQSLPNYAPSKLVVAESGGNRVDIATADALVMVGAGYSGPWDTEVEVANPESSSISLALTRQLYFNPCCIHCGSCDQKILSMASHGTAHLTFSSSGTAPGFSAWYGSPSFDLPSVKARVVNKSMPGVSVDLPVLRYSTILNLNPAVLTFPSVTKSSTGARSNLIISDVSGGPSMSFQVDLFSSAGQLLATAPFTITTGGTESTMFIQDIAGALGVTDLHEGSVRVARTSPDGLLWGVLMTVAEDGSLTYSTGQNP